MTCIAHCHWHRILWITWVSVSCTEKNSTKCTKDKYKLWVINVLGIIPTYPVVQFVALDLHATESVLWSPKWTKCIHTRILSQRLKVHQSTAKPARAVFVTLSSYSKSDLTWTYSFDPRTTKDTGRNMYAGWLRLSVWAQCTSGLVRHGYTPGYQWSYPDPYPPYTHTHYVGMDISGGYVRVPCGLANPWVYSMGLGYLILKRKVWLLNLYF